MLKHHSLLLLFLLTLPLLVNADDAVYPPNIEPVHWPYSPVSDQNMQILFLGLEGMDIPENAEIGCFTPDGILGGSAVVTGDTTGFSAWADDPETEEIEGFRHREAISFKYWDPIRNWELDINPDVVRGELIFRDFGLVVLYGALGVTDDPVFIPDQITLDNIYPSPFNSAARIEFNLDRKSHVTLSVYDITGRQVATLVDGIVERGKHGITLDGKGLLSGIYLVALESGERRIVKRVVLIR